MYLNIRLQKKILLIWKIALPCSTSQEKRCFKSWACLASAIQDNNIFNENSLTWISNTIICYIWVLELSPYVPAVINTVCFSLPYSLILILTPAVSKVWCCQTSASTCGQWDCTKLLSKPVKTLDKSRLRTQFSEKSH